MNLAVRIVAALAALAFAGPAEGAMSGAFPLHPAQWEIFHSPARHRFVVCGRDFGKTHEAEAEIARAAASKRAAQLGELAEIVYVGPSFRQVKKIVWKRLKRLFPPHLRRGKPNETELTIPLRNGCTVNLMGADNINVSRGMKAILIVFDEFAFYKEGVWEAFEGCLPTEQDRALIITTPNGPNHAWKLWNDVDGDPEWARFQKPTWANPFVSPRTIEGKKRRLARNVFEQEYGAQFEAQRGAVYVDFSPKDHESKALQLDPALPVHVGQDFNAGHYCAVIAQKRGNALAVVDELVTTTTLQDHILELRRYFKARGVNHERFVTICSDSSGAWNDTAKAGQFDEYLFKDAGFRTHHGGQNPHRIDRVHAVQSLMRSATGEIRFSMSDRCQELRRALLSQKWSPWGNQPEKAHGFDDLTDALGYVTWALFPIRPPGGDIRVV